MVYVQPCLLGWRPVTVSRVSTLPTDIIDTHKEHIFGNFDWFVLPCLRIVMKEFRMPRSRRFRLP